MINFSRLPGKNNGEWRIGGWVDVSQRAHETFSSCHVAHATQKKRFGGKMAAKHVGAPLAVALRRNGGEMAAKWRRNGGEMARSVGARSACPMKKLKTKN